MSDCEMEKFLTFILLLLGSFATEALKRNWIGALLQNSKTVGEIIRLLESMSNKSMNESKITCQLGRNLIINCLPYSLHPVIESSDPPW